MTDPKPIASYLMDMDGVIVREDNLIPGADTFIARLREHAKPFLILTNNSRHTPRDLVARLQRIGLDVTDSDIWTSALATASVLDRCGLRVQRLVVHHVRAARVDEDRLIWQGRQHLPLVRPAPPSALLVGPVTVMTSSPDRAQSGSR